MKLLVLNYSMNETSQVFSHQRTIVERLSDHFDHIDVITSESYNKSPIPKVSVFSCNWVYGRNFRNVINFYRVALPILFQHRKGVVFSHMTEVQSLLISPLCKLLGIRHFLWYAHKSKSLYLSFSYPFLDGLLTSTRGSCPIQGSKVKPIGQSINLEISRQVMRAPKFPPQSWYHIGRLDASKNIEQIVEVLEPYHSHDSRISLHFYGTPSSEVASKYFNNLREKYSDPSYDWVIFHGQMKSSDLVEVSNMHDAFIHAFWGSLDKALLEAILLKRIVVSSNPEYLLEFREKRINREFALLELKQQLARIYSLNMADIQQEIARNLFVARENHGLENWINQLISILKATK